MDLKKILLASVLFTILAQIVHTIGSVLTMGFYTDPAYFSVWSKIMMPGPGAPPMEFFALSLLFGFVTALIYVKAYEVVKKSLPGKEYVQKGVSYGALLFLVGSLPYSFMLLLLINLPLMLIAEWATESLIISLAGSVLIAKLVE